MIASVSLLTPEAFEHLPPDLTVMVFPVGGLEGHGPNLPMGVKLIYAEALSKQLCERLDSRMSQWNFILMPLLPLTVDTVTSRLALPVRAHVVRDALVDQCEHLKRMGFKNFIAVSAHL